MALLICLLLNCSHWLVTPRSDYNMSFSSSNPGPRATTLWPLPPYQTFSLLLPVPVPVPICISAHSILKCRITWPLCLGTTKMTSVGGPSSWSQTSVHGSEMLIPMTGVKSSTNCESEDTPGVRMQVRTPAVLPNCTTAKTWEGQSRAAQPSTPFMASPIESPASIFAAALSPNH